MFNKVSWNKSVCLAVYHVHCVPAWVSSWRSSFLPQIKRVCCKCGWFSVSLFRVYPVSSPVSAGIGSSPLCEPDVEKQVVNLWLVLLSCAAFAVFILHGSTAIMCHISVCGHVSSSSFRWRVQKFCLSTFMFWHVGDVCVFESFWSHCKWRVQNTFWWVNVKAAE